MLEATVNGSKYTGEQIRAAFGLRSPVFTISADKSAITFSVKGYGHGVGMSQHGANYLAKEGYDQNNCEHKVVVCGDLFDRMDESIQVYEFVKEMARQDRLIYVRGNHENLLKECVKEIQSGRLPGYHHFRNGTIKTIRYY